MPKPNTVTVRNLAQINDKPIIYVGIPPEIAVVCAYAQYELNDWTTWDYDKYKHLVTFGKHTVTCGDYCAIKPTQEYGYA